jgi:hypothetical protein
MLFISLLFVRTDGVAWSKCEKNNDGVAARPASFSWLAARIWMNLNKEKWRELGTYSSKSKKY